MFNDAVLVFNLFGVLTRKFCAKGLNRCKLELK